MKLLISLFCSLLFLMCMNLQAQGLYQKGSVTFKKGKSTDAYVQMDYKYPQRFQNSITYITPSTYAKYLKKGKIKGSKKIKLKPKEIEGFHLDNGQIFKTVSYADITGKAIKMMPKKLCLEQLASGEIDLYKLYTRTTGTISYELADYVREGGQELIDILTTVANTDEKLLTVENLESIVESMFVGSIGGGFGAVATTMLGGQETID